LDFWRYQAKLSNWLLGRHFAMIVYTYNLWLVGFSIAISFMSTFTGLILTRNLSAQPPAQKQVRIIMAAIALGGGIWSMHFVAMLSMRFGIPVFYEAIETVGSALIAILLAGSALLILHFGRRTRVSIAVSGTILGLGIVGMHFVGLSAIASKPSLRQAGWPW
jgi:diguanylate cyclase